MHPGGFDENGATSQIKASNMIGGTPTKPLK
jgi:hypothetical protein